MLQGRAASHAQSVAQQVKPVNEAAAFAANFNNSDTVWDAYIGLCNTTSLHSPQVKRSSCQKHAAMSKCDRGI